MLAPTRAQQDLGSITGRIVDPSKAVIGGADMTITNQGTGVKLATVTNEAGNYAARSLPYGNYQIGVRAACFR